MFTNKAKPHQMENEPNEKPGMHHDAQALLFQFARKHREKPTQAEAILWEVLSNKKLEGHKFRRQHPIGKFILDFYCHASKLAVEVDGGYHFTKEQAENDQNRTKVLESLGIHVIRFTNEQVLNQLSAVVEDIRICLAAPNP